MVHKLKIVPSTIVVSTFSNIRTYYDTFGQYNLSFCTRGSRVKVLATSLYDGYLSC